MVKTGLRVGLGLDGISINDDDDMIQEMRVCFLLHRLNALDVAAPCLTARETFKMATDTNAHLIGYGQDLGRLVPGRKADMVLLDYDGCAEETPDALLPGLDGKNRAKTLLYRQFTDR